VLKLLKDHQSLSAMVALSINTSASLKLVRNIDDSLMKLLMKIVSFSADYDVIYEGECVDPAIAPAAAVATEE
jgi:hypothetical protein